MLNLFNLKISYYYLNSMKTKKPKIRNPIAREMRTSLANLYRQRIEQNKKKVVKKFDIRKHEE